MKKILIICTSIIFALILIFLFQYDQNKNLPKIDNGVIDISNWNPYTENSIVLSGKWDFYWKKLISDDKDYSKDAPASIPAYWNGIVIHGNSLPGYGFATYRLKVKAKQGEKLYLKINSQSTAYRLIISGKEIAHNGIVSSNSNTGAAEYLPLVTYFTAPSDEFYINFQVSNYATWRGGFKSPIIMGSEEKIRIINNWNTFFLDLLSGCTFILFCFFLIIFFTENRNVSFLYFSLCGLDILLSRFFSYNYVARNYFPHISFHLSLTIGVIIYYWISVTFLLYINSIFSKKITQIATHIAVIIALSLSLLTLILPTNIFSALQDYFSWLHIIYLSFIIFTLVKEFKDGNKDVLPMLIATSLIFTTVANDILYSYNLFRIVDMPLAPFGVFALMISIVFVFAKQYIRNYNKNKELLDQIIYINAVKDEFLVNVSKELRTPVNSIIVSTEKFKASTYKHIESPELKAIEQIHSSGLRVLDMLNNIMIYSKLQYDELKFNKEIFSISILLKGIISEYSYLIGNDISYIPSENSEKTPLVYADRYWISRVLYNLFNICLKHTENRNNILVKTKIEHKKVYIHIYSSGMPLETIELIQGHFMDDEKHSTIPDNLGVSIYIIKYIIKNHNNIISIKPTYSGYKFTFTLDISDEKLFNGNNDPSFEDLGKNNIITPWITFKTDGANKTAVIIANDVPNIKAISGALNQIDFSVNGFIIGKNALKYIENEKDIDVAIMEAAIPDISGFEICSRLRKKYTKLELPVIIITSRVESESVIQSFEAGANDCVFEPYDIVELRARIDTLCSLKKAISTSIENEMAFLRAQIKPHFLFNVLNTITCYCYTDPSASIELIEKLSMYLRYSFDFDIEKKECLLCDEVEFTRNYLDIEKARFGELIYYEFNIENSDNIYVPPFIVQPLVENSLKHGILKKPNGGKVLICGKQNNGNYILTVEDNGIGMSEDKLKGVLLGELADGTGIGLKNIRKRLKHIYNTDLLIESTLNKGTKVTITLKI
ncbi:histidine kinase [Clostridium pasteurianum]|uniref:Stage 0 sporulation protein A homolog n=1 Tax=Clostridium pasteurianum BC1 TaxID=86416 RepID=R4K274_CLOPA|nr:histidine kinase [Clostridium pasteurianum]AGK95856.1 putative regulator of cell autolysis [Clostridium pasteurianum BC1]